jgi:NADH:ubiquinone oxidoreductase subunit B-like Fe-S oxidoreductase
VFILLISRYGKFSGSFRHGIFLEYNPLRNVFVLFPVTVFLPICPVTQLALDIPVTEIL